MKNFRTLGQNLLGEKYCDQKKEKENNAVNSGHYVLPATPKGMHTRYSNQITPLILATSVCPEMRIVASKASMLEEPN